MRFWDLIWPFGPKVIGSHAITFMKLKKILLSSKMFMSSATKNISELAR